MSRTSFFWRNPLSPALRAMLSPGFARGSLGEIARISLFAIATLIAVAALFD